MFEKLFVYGTLQQPKIQRAVIGKTLHGISDSLLGFKKSTIKIDDTSYPIIEKDPHSQEETHGIVLDVSEEDLKKLDDYEGNAYQRKKIILKSGLSVWVYQK